MTRNDFKKILWQSADRLRSAMDGSEYKHIVLGLLFLKYLSDSFEKQRNELEKQFSDPNSDNYLSNSNEIESELEDRDYYLKDNVYWVPKESRWENLRNNASADNFGKRIDDALRAVEDDNKKLKGILNKNYTNVPLSNENLAELYNKLGEIDTQDSGKKDLLGEIYEYFLGKFALSEGKRGGQYYTAQSVVKILIEILSPEKGKIYDPCCGSGGMFVQTMKFVDAHNNNDHKNISIYGQESNPTTWKLANMNLAIRGLDYRLGNMACDTFHNDCHPDLRADYIMANPPFNISEWGGDKLTHDSRWKYGIPPSGNANYAWLQHILYHLSSNGRAGVVLSNGSMSTTQGGEDSIRKNMIDNDLVECMVALPGQLFTNTPIPVCIWFLAKNKKRTGEILFIDARDKGFMETRVLRNFTDDEIIEFGTIYKNWLNDTGYQDIKGYCKSASIDEIKEQEYTLTPGRYVGVADLEDDGIPFGEKMSTSTDELKKQFAERERLQAEIKTQLAKVGVSFDE